MNSLVVESRFWVSAGSWNYIRTKQKLLSEPVSFGLVAGGRYEVQKRNRAAETEVVWVRFAARGSVLVLVGDGGRWAPKAEDSPRNSPRKSLPFPAAIV